jgi:hypothetical protein
MRYLIAIPAFLACLFYIYVLIQLRRDEKRYRPPVDSGTFIGKNSEKLISYTAVRPAGRSFAQWSRLARKPAKTSRERVTPKAEEPEHQPLKQRSITYVELALPLSSGVAPITGSDVGHNRR